MKVLVTGSAGFIGHHVVLGLCNAGYDVVGLDNLNAYYDLGLKKSRLAQQGFDDNFIYGKQVQSSLNALQFVQLDLSDKDRIIDLFKTHNFDFVINLAAQAGVRYSLVNPQVYIDSNVSGFLNILEACRAHPVKHLVFASSSSVYGLNEKIPFEVEDDTSHPISLYAASKKSNELMAHSYSHLFNLPTTGLRFFTVYGPWGRPDMALFIFAKAIIDGTAFDVYNNGEMKRDFTFVDDIVESIIRLLPKPPKQNANADLSRKLSENTTAPYQIFNIGNNLPVNLIDFIHAIEKASGKKGIKVMKPLQPGDVVTTYADVKSLEQYIGFSPSTNLQEGVNKFVAWYMNYYSNNQNNESASVQHTLKTTVS